MSNFLFKTLSKLLLIVSWLFALIVLPVAAQAPQEPQPSDVRIVIDISGSMKKNDPQNLRIPALDMLSRLMPEGSKAGVWTFGHYVNMLVKHRPVNEQWRREAESKSQSINSVAQFTSIGQALEKAAYDKNYSIKDNYKTHVIILTDGMVDIDRDPVINTKERNRILNEVLPAYQQADYTIHTVSLSENADKQLMDRLALATDGKSVVAKSADELMNVFLEVFDQAVPAEELPLNDNTFLTDSSIEEFTALIFRQPNSEDTQLIGPDNKAYTKSSVDPSLKWFHTDKYDLVTVKRPLEGEWRILAKLEPQSRITVVSDLSLVVKPMPTNIKLGDSIELSLALREENKVVTRAEFLQLLDIGAKVYHLTDDTDVEQEWSNKLSGGLVPGNGVYNTKLEYFNQVGAFKVDINVDGKTFQRQFTHRLNVRELFAVETDYSTVGGQAQYIATVIPQSASIDYANTEVVGKLKVPSGSSTIQKFDLTESQVWELVISPTEEGIYYLSMRVTTKDKRGQPQDFIPQSLSFQFPEKDNSFEQLIVNTPEPETFNQPAVNSLDESEEEPEVFPEATEVVEENVPVETDYTQWILYGALGLSNLLIIFVIYILYRKLFGSSSSNDDDDDDFDEVQQEQPIQEKSPPKPSFDEPPMDEMIINDLEDEIDLAVDEPAEPEGIDIDLSVTDDEEEPEFSLDDFAPDALDDEFKK